MGTFNVPVVKAKQMIVVDTDKLPEGAYEKIVMAGLKHYVNSQMSNITAASMPDEEARALEAMSRAAINVEKMYADEIKAIPGTKSKTKGPAKSKTRTLAMQDARNRIKAEAKRQGKKIAHIGAKEISRLAAELLDHPVIGPVIWEKAEKVAAEADTSLEGLGIEIVIDDRKVKQDVAKNERAKAKKAGAEVEPEGLSVPKETPQAHVIAAQQGGGKGYQPGRR